jgi:hypothetical protein
MAKTQGCANATVHEGHEWQAVIRGRRGRTEPRWCPGRVECGACQKAVFRSTVTTVNGRTVCRGGCRT